MCENRWKNGDGHGSAARLGISVVFWSLLLGALTTPCLSAGEEQNWEWLDREEIKPLAEQLTAEWSEQRTAVAIAHLK